MRLYYLYQNAASLYLSFVTFLARLLSVKLSIYDFLLDFSLVLRALILYFS